ncbi:hypothetical protein L7F22_013279 [Adiantum nelumboides]|nr:hypothetical protein [Adiantum nelumboides]
MAFLSKKRPTRRFIFVATTICMHQVNAVRKSKEKNQKVTMYMAMAAAAATPKIEAIHIRAGSATAPGSLGGLHTLRSQAEKFGLSRPTTSSVKSSAKNWVLLAEYLRQVSEFDLCRDTDRFCLISLPKASRAKKSESCSKQKAEIAQNKWSKELVQKSS